MLFTGSLLANALRLLNVSKQFHTNGVWFALKNSALYYAITHDSLPSLRNFVLGPLTEEFVFRSCMIPLLVCADFTVKQIVLGSPLTFGVGAFRSHRPALVVRMELTFSLSLSLD